MMIKRLKLCVLWGITLYSSVAMSHPHAFIDMKTQALVEQNQLVGFAIQWTLDEASSSPLLYDLQLAEGEADTKQKILDEVMGNIISEHYFSYLFDKEGNKVKFKAKPRKYDMTADNVQVSYHFELMLAEPQLLQNKQLELSTYDSTYFVAMSYDTHEKTDAKSAVDFSQLPSHCQGKIIEPNVSQKMKEYAASLDRNEVSENASLGKAFAQQVVISCQ